MFDISPLTLGITMGFYWGSMILTLLKILPIMYAIQLLSHIAESGLNLALMKAMQKDSGLIFIVAVGVILNALISTWLSTGVFLTIVAKDIHSEAPLTTRWHDLFRESLKAMGEASLWIFVFLIPGLWRFLAYSLLPFVVFFDPEYQSNRAEILSRTRDYAKGKMKILFLAWFVFQALIPILISAIFTDYNFFDRPFKALLVLIIVSVSQLAFLTWLFKIFKSQKQKLTLNLGGAHA